ncbi:hypothetical protein BS50DRAFT_619498 [Corynespora cassiicola Philippines]|uniref:DUF7918 domain-containing protein n=1 Tax=Corynespora cassiicola Philippines TaxID=1448308 RepID=A0A2T2NTB7_CORCC|nr:hypothetical protein BS50DRAFT_619498 [Corynespora cassiicola Philippines]
MDNPSLASYVTVRIQEYPILLCGSATVNSLTVHVTSRPPGSPRLLINMAVLHGCPGLEVWITVNGKALKEYDDDEKPPLNTVVKYIEVSTNSEIKVEWRHTRPSLFEEGCLRKVWLDGNEVTQGTTDRQTTFREHGECVGKKEIKNGRMQVSRFRFSEVIIEKNLGENSNKYLNTSISKAGRICILFFRVKNVRSSSSITTYNHIQKKEISSPSEKDLILNGISHNVTLSKDVEYLPVDCSRFQHLDGLDKPTVTLIFKYRSLESLKALRILQGQNRNVPPVQPNASSFGTRSTADLSREEMMVLLNYYRGRETTSHMIKEEPQIKRERPDNSDSQINDDIMVTEERSAKRRRLPSANDEDREIVYIYIKHCYPGGKAYLASEMEQGTVRAEILRELQILDDDYQIPQKYSKKHRNSGDRGFNRFYGYGERDVDIVTAEINIYCFGRYCGRSWVN